MSRQVTYRLRLYVAGGALNSMQALKNLRAFCASELPGRHEIEIVDVFREPQRALADTVFMTPTLVKLGPGAQVRIVGTLSDVEPLHAALGLQAQAA